LLEDKTHTSQADEFRTFLATVVHVTFDYLVEHPRFRRILTWEMAEGWQTYMRIVADFPPEDTSQFERLFTRARRAGILRSQLSPLIQLTLIFQTCQTYLGFLPVYQLELPGEVASSPAALIRAREGLVEWVAGAMLVDLAQASDITNRGGTRA
jgi:TetR/AcrR family transcriptional regulator